MRARWDPYGEGRRAGQGGVAAGRRACGRGACGIGDDRERHALDGYDGGSGRGCYGGMGADDRDRAGGRGGLRGGGAVPAMSGVPGRG